MERKVILLVEDDAALRNLLKETLFNEFEVLESSNYSEAVNRSENNIDLALIDYALPGRDGFEVLKMLREKRPSLPAIMMTAYSSEALAIKAVREDVTDYIKKPFYFEHLKMRITEVFEGKKSPEHLGSPANRDEFIIEGLLMYMKNNYVRDITLTDLAQMVSMDKYKLSRTFKSTTGQSLLSYLNNVRLERAVELLKISDLSMKEIAYWSGFKSVEHFNRLFSALYETSPGEFRQGLKQKD